MSDKIYIAPLDADGSASDNKDISATEPLSQISQIGATMEALYSTICDRKSASTQESYTNKLLTGKLDDLLKKVSEEALESCLAAKECEMLQGKDRQKLDESIDHMRYEAADVIYHLLVLMARFDISIDELAAELNMRMREDERPEGCAMLQENHVRRGK